MQEMERNGWQDSIYYKQWQDFLNGRLNQNAPSYEEMIQEYEQAKKSDLIN